MLSRKLVTAALASMMLTGCALALAEPPADHHSNESTVEEPKPATPTWFDQWGALGIATLVAVPLGIWMTRFYSLKDKAVSDREQNVTDREHAIDERIKEALSAATQANERIVTVQAEAAKNAAAEADKVRAMLAAHIEQYNEWQRRMERDLGKILGRIENKDD